MIELSMASALAYILDTMPFLSLKLWFQGGSISFAMLPIFLISFRWGLKAGLLNGFIFGLLQVVTGQASQYIVHPVQGFIDYFLAFTVLGLAGVFAVKVKESYAARNKRAAVSFVVSGVLLGGFARFLCHYVAGIIFFAEYAPKGQPVALYSFVYNISYVAPSVIICAVLLSLLFSSAPLLARAGARA
nr:energy-coupled thiamine transporter ThiT [Ectobacillus ponti]